MHLILGMAPPLLAKEEGPPTYKELNLGMKGIGLSPVTVERIESCHLAMQTQPHHPGAFWYRASTATTGILGRSVA
jgi:hypothetical protein